MGKKILEVVTALFIIITLFSIPHIFAEETGIQSRDTGKGDDALAKIKNLKTIEMKNYIIFTNIYGEEKFNKILHIITHAVPAISNELSFGGLKNKVKVLILNDYEYRDFFANIGYDYSKRPYGFSLPEQYFAIVNSDLGEGTLLHELMHILIFNDIQKAPQWIDEGIACLYEESGWRNNKIYVRNNWRLPLVKKIINTPEYIKLSDLLRIDRFTHSGKMFPASEARYIMFYLWEKKMLVEFYKEYKATKGEDYYGIKALGKIVGMDIDRFEQEWLEWLSEL